MTILINGYVQLEAGKETIALEGASDLMAETRSQKGCRHYVWSADPAVPGRIYVYENWETEADLAAHLAGRHYSDMLAHMGQYEMLDMDILKYRIDLAEPVYDPEGVPRADFFTA